MTTRAEAYGELDKQKKFSIRDIVYICAFVIILAGNYFINNARISNVEKKASENSQTLKDNNLELINYKLDEIKKAINKLAE